jgi:hypothetical protein
MRTDHKLSNKESISMKDLAGMNVYIPDDSHRMSQRFIQYWPEFYKSIVIDFTTNEYESFYHTLPKSNCGIALTFRFLCNELDPELTYVILLCEKGSSQKSCIRAVFRLCISECGCI